MRQIKNEFCQVNKRVNCEKKISFADVDEESVRNYLRTNPSFLEDYVMKYVDQERLERWLIRKTRKLKNKGSKKNVNSIEHENNKQSGKSQRAY